MRPHEPPIACRDLPATGGAIGPSPEDFVVDEIPLYAASGKGEHLYVLVRKRRFSTPEMVREIARAAGVAERDIGYAGLKDKHAVTTQWLSLPRRAADPASWQLPEGIGVERATHHENKLRTGHLSANRFRITLRGCEPDAPSRALAIRDRLRAAGVVNYFGAQRFGQRGENLGRALEWLRGGATKRVGRFLAKLYPSVIQAELFNRYSTRRAELGLDRLISGEVVRLEGSGAMFRVEDVKAEQPRFDSGDLHLTGPIPGPRTRPAADAALELETAVLRELELTPAELEALGREAPGSRRDLVIRVADLEVDAPAEDAGALVISFTLPSGSYATQVAREFTRAPFLSDEPRGGAV